MGLVSKKTIYFLFLCKLVNIGCLMQERWVDSDDHQVPLPNIH